MNKPKFKQPDLTPQIVNDSTKDDLVPVDSGPFRPEDVLGLERVSKIENNSWSRWEMAGLIIEGNPNVGIAIHAGEFNRYRYTGPWPSKAFALLLLKELGIGGGE